MCVLKTRTSLNRAIIMINDCAMFKDEIRCCKQQTSLISGCLSPRFSLNPCYSINVKLCKPPLSCKSWWWLAYGVYSTIKLTLRQHHPEVSRTLTCIFFLLPYTGCTQKKYTKANLIYFKSLHLCFTWAMNARRW